MAWQHPLADLCPREGCSSVKSWILFVGEISLYIVRVSVFSTSRMPLGGPIGLKRSDTVGAWCMACGCLVRQLWQNNYKKLISAQKIGEGCPASRPFSPSDLPLIWVWRSFHFKCCRRLIEEDSEMSWERWVWLQSDWWSVKGGLWNLLVAVQTKMQAWNLMWAFLMKMMTAVQLYLCTCCLQALIQWCCQKW